MTKLDAIRNKITRHFSPTYLHLVDVSQRHRNHKQNDPNKIHIELTIASQHFYKLGDIACHRAIYKLLAPEIETIIHSLKISINR
ncbi:MAG: hypothetical protein CMF46_01350 [Legionellales bacterium]|nr:hypothetical protein [Legionellales bacterium]|tara:strand:- start:931 stop:1185 length:255 start_codon:yes stop_codon:yes gene_type:complete